MSQSLLGVYERDLVIVQGKGAYLVDKDGRKYLDFAAGVGVNGLGYRDSKVLAAIKKQSGPQTSADEKVDRHFRGKKSGWRPVYDRLVEKVTAFGPDTDVLPGATYLSLRRAGKKFAIVQVTADRLDVGIKLGGAPATERLEAAGGWNSMVTHRVCVHGPVDVDRQLVGWLERAYKAA